MSYIKDKLQAINNQLGNMLRMALSTIYYDPSGTEEALEKMHREIHKLIVLEPKPPKDEKIKKQNQAVADYWLKALTHDTEDLEPEVKYHFYKALAGKLQERIDAIEEGMDERYFDRE